MEAGDNDKVADLGGSGVVGRAEKTQAQSRVAAVASREGEDDPREAYLTRAEKTQAQPRVAGVASRGGGDSHTRALPSQADGTQMNICEAAAACGIGGDSKSKAIPIITQVGPGGLQQEVGLDTGCERSYISMDLFNKLVNSPDGVSIRQRRSSSHIWCLALRGWVPTR